MAKFCRNCGSPIKEGVKFCPECGYDLKTVQTKAQDRSGPESKAQTAMKCPRCGAAAAPGKKYCVFCGAPITGSASTPAEPPKRVNLTEQFIKNKEQSAGASAAGRGQGSQKGSKPTSAAQTSSPDGPKKSKKGLIFAAILLVGIFLFTAFVTPGFLRGKDDPDKGTTNDQSGASNNKTDFYTGKGFEKTEISYSGGGFDVGTLKDNGLNLHIDEGAIAAGNSITAEPIPVDKLKALGVDGKFKRIVAPFDISSEGYDGSALDGIELTVSMPKLNGESDWDIAGYVFCYYNESKKEIEYFRPEKVDYAKNTMSITLPHFSWWWGAQLTREEEIELFLDEYCMKTVVQQSQDQKLAAELGPYVQAKAEALGMTSKATKDFTQSLLSALGGKIRFTGENGETASDLAGLTYEQFLTLSRAYWDSDAEAIPGMMDSILTGLTVQLWKEGKYSERAAKVFKSEAFKEFAPGSIDTFVQNFGSFGYILGAIWEGDVEGAAQKAGEVMEGYHPAVSIGTKSVRLIASGVNSWFTDWKDAQVEELYVIYRDGATFLFGNTVQKRDRETFLEYLNYSSGFTKAKGVARFYRLDKIDQVCKRYGWSFDSYSEMPEKYRKIFDERAENELLEYFELRASQEDAAKALKESMRPMIASLFNTDTGALEKSLYKAFFHEEEYDVRARLERIIRIKAFLGTYVDDEKAKRSEKLGGNGWGEAINWWLMYASTEPKSRAIEHLIADLKEYDLLKEGMDAEFDTATELNAFLGEWTGVQEYTRKGDSYSDYYKIQVRFEIYVNKNGEFVIRQFKKTLQHNNKTVDEEEERVNTEILKDKNYLLSGGTLTVLYPDNENNIGDYMYRFKYDSVNKLEYSEYLYINPYLYVPTDPSTLPKAWAAVTTLLTRTK